MRKLTIGAFVVSSVLCAAFVGTAQDDSIQPGDTLQLVERSPAPPFHKEPKNSFKGRFDSGGTVVVDRLDPGGSHYLFVKQADGKEGWLHPKYVAEKIAAGGAAPVTPTGDLKYVIGCWNLEYFKNGKTRGFPENTRGGTSFPPRTPAQIREIARVITTDLNASLLVLNEINGKTGTDADGDAVPVSEELDALVAELPNGWTYIITWSGRSQRIALLYNSNTVRINEVIEYSIDSRRIQGKDIFDRDPIAAWVTFMHNGVAKNDLVIVGVHLASGQDNNRNHDTAMSVLRERLNASFEAGELGGSSEADVLILGDMNANMFRSPSEEFFIEMDAPAQGRWDVLAGDSYSATRLSGVPLALDRSQIDYIIATRKRTVSGTETDGLMGDEIAKDAKVHTQLIAAQGGAGNYRRDLSDHLPVTVEVKVGPDGD